MPSPKDILVITTATTDTIKIKQYLKPVTAHIVAGTNFFSDFFASFSDLFGGRSGTYQKQLGSLYSEAIDRVKFAAYELGANGVVGLSIDLDEISGKGKSMFMLTAIGTAVIFEKSTAGPVALPGTDEKFENVSVDKINLLRNKKMLIEKAEMDNLNLNDDTWNFATTNQVSELAPYIMKKFSEMLSNELLLPEQSEQFYKNLTTYLDALPEEKKTGIVYEEIKKTKGEKKLAKLATIVRELYLYDHEKNIQLLQSPDFAVRKIGLQISSYDKPFYNQQDKADIEKTRKLIQTTFTERGTRSTKKQLLSSKEKDVWVCECGRTNDIDNYCSSCGQDIYGFKEKEAKPATVSLYLEQKMELISEYLA